MSTVLEIGKKVIDCKIKGEEYLSQQERIDILLDNISLLTKQINKINTCFLSLFPLLDELSACELEGEGELLQMKKIINELDQLRTDASIFFSKLMKFDVVKNGCKSALSDLRINIRNLREYVEDIEETFLLEEEDVDLNNLITELL